MGRKSILKDQTLPCDTSLGSASSQSPEKKTKKRRSSLKRRVSFNNSMMVRPIAKVGDENSEPVAEDYQMPVIVPTERKPRESDNRGWANLPPITESSSSGESRIGCSTSGWTNDSNVHSLRQPLGASNFSSVEIQGFSDSECPPKKPRNSMDALSQDLENMQMQSVMMSRDSSFVASRNPVNISGLDDQGGSLLHATKNPLSVFEPASRGSVSNSPVPSPLALPSFMQDVTVATPSVGMASFLLEDEEKNESIKSRDSLFIPDPPEKLSLPSPMEDELPELSFLNTTVHERGSADESLSPLIDSTDDCPASTNLPQEREESRVISASQPVPKSSETIQAPPANLSMPSLSNISMNKENLFRGPSHVIQLQSVNVTPSQKTTPWKWKPGSGSAKKKINFNHGSVARKSHHIVQIEYPPLGDSADTGDDLKKALTFKPQKTKRTFAERLTAVAQFHARSDEGSDEFAIFTKAHGDHTQCNSDLFEHFKAISKANCINFAICEGGSQTEELYLDFGNTRAELQKARKRYERKQGMEQRLYQLKLVASTPRVMPWNSEFMPRVEYTSKFVNMYFEYQAHSILWVRLDLDKKQRCIAHSIGRSDSEKSQSREVTTLANRMVDFLSLAIEDSLPLENVLKFTFNYVCSSLVALGLEPGA